jgi:hypothetical protein
MRGWFVLVVAASLFTTMVAACSGNTPAGRGTHVSEVLADQATPSPTPWPITGHIQTRMEASCRLGLTGPEIVVRYEADIVDGVAELSRVRIAVDKKVKDDSGPIREQTYLRETTLAGLSNQMLTIELFVDSKGAEPGPPAIQFVRCPRTPRYPRA